MKWGCRALLLALLACAGPAAAHEFRPSLLEVTESQPGQFSSVLRQARWSDGFQDVRLRRPEGCMEVSGDAVVEEEYRVLREEWTCKKALAGQTLEFQGLDRYQADVMIQVQLGGGKRVQGLASSSQPSFRIATEERPFAAFGRFLDLGVHHVLGGADHVLFVTCLTLLAGLRWRKLLAATTAFTVAHSLTLALSVLGYLSVQQAVAEVVIAASVLLLALELRRGRQELDPWQFSTMAFVCGLFHGLGFASAFREAGVIQHALPLTLLAFNLGVEAGQVLIVLCVCALIGAGRRLPRAHLMAVARAWCATLIGGVAIFWCIQRLPALLAG